MRDFTGYGAQPPHAAWPHQAKIAVQFVLNYEEGAERSVLEGDAHAETFLSEIIGAPAIEGRHLSMESLYEYGSRAGFWRLHRLFQAYQLPLTVFGVAVALERNRPAVDAMLRADWEIACHGYRWLDYQHIPEAVERDHIHRAIALHEAIVGSKPSGWYTGRDSPNTRRLILEHEHFVYDSDSYADDLPYWISTPSKPHLIVPYTLDVNDMRFNVAQGFNSGDQFFTYLKDAFTTLYQEGENRPKMMSIGLHPRIIGKPGRIQALQRFLDFLVQQDRVWVARRIDIAEHWQRQHPPPSVPSS
ncbi:MAG: allantoinase [Gammaproteobacteria bacterium TMED95]|jgi:putative urate catabolism protein|nr:allantoinase PuuE [Gammaproteobacteria bacterium]OUV23713.1 MAG: allantoinase [Gammaproteobacteria bacterium TMED95]|tara:strand:+ start:2239 stop:3144 length:906 start_codon:yes stop_codon:yes gene_type:complete